MYRICIWYGSAWHCLGGFCCCCFLQLTLEKLARKWENIDVKCAMDISEKCVKVPASKKWMSAFDKRFKDNDSAIDFSSPSILEMWTRNTFYGQLRSPSIPTKSTNYFIFSLKLTNDLSGKSFSTFFPKKDKTNFLISKLNQNNFWKIF